MWKGEGPLDSGRAVEGACGSSGARRLEVPALEAASSQRWTLTADATGEKSRSGVAASAEGRTRAGVGERGHRVPRAAGGGPPSAASSAGLGRLEAVYVPAIASLPLAPSTSLRD